MWDVMQEAIGGDAWTWSALIKSTIHVYTSVAHLIRSEEKQIFFAGAGAGQNWMDPDLTQCFNIWRISAVFEKKIKIVN